MNTLAMPPKVRVYVYAAIGLVSLAVGAVQVGFASINEPNPEWLTVALAVVPFLASGLGAVALTHTPKAEDVAYVGEHRAVVVEEYPGQVRDELGPDIEPQGYTSGVRRVMRRLLWRLGCSGVLFLLGLFLSIVLTR